MSLIFALPHPALRPHVRHYAEVSLAQPPWGEVRAQTIPTGGLVLTVRWAGDLQIEAGPARGRVPAASLTGQTLRAEAVCMTGSFRAFLVAFRPAGASDLLGVPAEDLQEHSASLGDVLGPPGVHLADRLANAPSFAARCASADDFFVRYLGKARPSLGARATSLVEVARGVLRVEDLARQLGVPERTFRRRFAEEVGMPAKVFTQLVRFRAAHAFLARTAEASWADAVVRFGYVDQSHLGRAYRRFAGVPPSYRIAAPEVFDGVEGVEASDGADPA